MLSTIILIVGKDARVMETPRLILRAAGYMVESAESLQRAVDLFHAGDFDLVILCHSIPVNDRERLARWIRNSGSMTPIISISQNLGQKDSFADATVESQPLKLLKVIKRLVTKAWKVSSTGTGMGDGSADGKSWRNTILSVEADANQLLLRRQLLEHAGYLALTANSGPDGLKVFSIGIADIVILDYAMPWMNGGAVAAQMRRIDKRVPLILLSGCSTVPEADLALFDRCVPKGDSPTLLLSVIDEILSATDEQRKSATVSHRTSRASAYALRIAPLGSD